ncbi:MAG: hypothetical protein GKR87_01135 [Kiritimatiellae bacterium]|nr:hypothetical protein [Kiritimatiellia bacterium]
MHWGFNNPDDTHPTYWKSPKRINNVGMISEQEEAPVYANLERWNSTHLKYKHLIRFISNHVRPSGDRVCARALHD